MIADLKPYAEYKESGLPWLGQVPGHWEVRRMKSAVMNVIEQTFEMSADEGYVALEHVESWTGKAYPQSDSSLFTGQVKRFRQGDVLFGKLRPYLAKVTRISKDGVCAGEFFVLRPTDKAVSSAYLEHQLRAKHTIDVINGSTFGAKMPRADWQFCGNLPVLLPPPDEQAAIVRFLDWATGRLERAIRAKRKVIALLGEQKQAIIHRAVTRGLPAEASAQAGLDPSVPLSACGHAQAGLKPSGIPWLGDIPQHWEVRRLGHAICLQTGFPFASAGFVQGESGIRLLRGINVTPSGLRWDSVVRWQRKPGDGLDEFELEIGDITLGMDRPIIGAGVRVATVQENDMPSLLLQRVARLRPTDKLDTKFLVLLLRGRLFRDYIAPIFTGISVPHLSPEQIKGFTVPLPALIEQRGIVSHVETETSGLETAISRLEREIELLREYRTRLVADVVTGKLDVREAAARLPDEPAPDTAEDAAELSDDPETADEEAGP